MATILLVDDNNFILSVFEKHLGTTNHKVVGKARDGIELITLYKQLKPDLVMLDIIMPQKNGLDGLKELMKLDPKAKVMVVSAHNDPAIAKECLSIGAKAFLSKTKIDLTDFSQTVFQTLERVLKN